jgi:hypothetical protein
MSAEESASLAKPSWNSSFRAWYKGFPVPLSVSTQAAHYSAWFTSPWKAWYLFIMYQSISDLDAQPEQLVGITE